MTTIKQSDRVTAIGARYITLSHRKVYVAQIDKDKGALILSPFWHYSSTTWQHVRKFIDIYKEELGETAQMWMHNMFNSQNGQAYMQMLVDNHIIRVQSDWTLYNQMIGDNCGGKRWK